MIDNSTPTSHPIIRMMGLVSDICGAIAAGMMLLAVLITCQMIWVRSVLNQSTIWQTEAVIYLMIAATLLGLPYVQRLRGHVNVDLLPLMLPAGLRKALAIVTLLMAIAVMGIMLFYGFDLWWAATVRGWRSDTVWGVPLWIPYLAMPVGFLLYVLQLCVDLFAIVTDAEPPFSIGIESAVDKAQEINQ